ncbi:hypothetical protein J4464_00890 [Candidatus Woesearchaeota archaeon]|nr:hypothetical protein [Candidatus Woesearchaeota archaeon]
MSQIGIHKGISYVYDIQTILLHLYLEHTVQTPLQPTPLGNVRPIPDSPTVFYRPATPECGAALIAMGMPLESQARDVIVKYLNTIDVNCPGSRLCIDDLFREDLILSMVD